MANIGNKYTSDIVLDFKYEETVNKDSAVVYSHLYND